MFNLVLCNWFPVEIVCIIISNSLVVHIVVIVDTVEPICVMTGGIYDFRSTSQAFL